MFSIQFLKPFLILKIFFQNFFFDPLIENIALGYASCDILFFEKHDILEPNIVQAIQDG